MKKKRMVLLIILLVMVMGFGVGCGSEEETLEPMVYKIAKEEIISVLKAPSTAEFSPIEETLIKKTLDGSDYFVSGYVDAENSFGGKIRSEYTVKIKIKDNKYISSDIIKFE